jgi:hypothetical protein
MILHRLFFHLVPVLVAGMVASDLASVSLSARRAFDSEAASI